MAVNPTQKLRIAEELRASREALETNDLRRALLHAGRAISYDPQDANCLAQLDELAARALATAEPLELVPLPASGSFDIAATRSYLLAKLGNYTVAIDLLIHVVERRPDLTYLPWAESWLAVPDAFASITTDDLRDHLWPGLIRFSHACAPMLTPDDVRFANLQSAGRIGKVFTEHHPTEPLAWLTSALVHGRLGDLQLATTHAEQAYSLEASCRSATAIASIFNARALPVEALRWYRTAVEHDPADATARRALADLCLENSQYSEAIANYDLVLAPDPSDSWALASRAYALYLRDGIDDYRLTLLQLAESELDPQRARDLSVRITPPEPFVTYLPPPADASGEALHNLLTMMSVSPTLHHGATLSLHVSHLEAPSLLAAFVLQMELWGIVVGVQSDVDNVQSPDPRQPSESVPFVLWTWDGLQPYRYYGRPTDELVPDLQALISAPFDLPSWNEQARILADKLGQNAVPGLLASLTWPPPPVDATHVLQWVQRAQVAIALVLANVDGEWQGSQRRQLLLALLHGPTDWTTTAVIIALGVLATYDTLAATIRTDVLTEFATLRQRIPQQGYCCWAYPLAATWANLLEPNDPALTELTTWKSQLWNTAGQSQLHMWHLEAPTTPVAPAATRSFDPVVFPGHPVATLTDYVKIMKRLQAGRMTSVLTEYGLDMLGYAEVATAWNAKFAEYPELLANYHQLMKL